MDLWGIQACFGPSLIASFIANFNLILVLSVIIQLTPRGLSLPGLPSSILLLIHKFLHTFLASIS